MQTEANKPVCIVVGVGPGNGEALARRFSAAGYAVALLARRTALCQRLAAELPDARAFACDVAIAGMVEQVFAGIADGMGVPDTLIYNAGKGV